MVVADNLAEATALAGPGLIDLAIVELPPAAPSPAAWIHGLVAPGMKILVIAAQADAESLRAADVLGANGVVERRAPLTTVLNRIRELVRPHPVIYDAGPPWPLPPGSR